MEGDNAVVNGSAVYEKIKKNLRETWQRIILII